MASVRPVVISGEFNMKQICENGVCRLPNTDEIEDENIKRMMDKIRAAQKKMQEE